MSRILFFTNIIPPYRVPVFKILAHEIDYFRIYISKRDEPNRKWDLAFDELDVVEQKSITLNKKWVHPSGFTEDLYVHIPYDTMVLLKRERPDVVISGELGIRTFQVVLFKILFNRHMRVVSYADVSEYTEKGRGFLRLWLRKFILKFSDGVIVNGESGMRYIKSVSEIDERHIHKIPYTTSIKNFLQESSFRPLEPNQPIKLIYVGQLIERKGLIKFIKQFESFAEEHPIPEPGFILDIYGDGPMDEEIKNIDTNESLVVNVKGYVNYEELPAVYSNYHIFVLPTLADTWALVVNEAMACGLPVLGSVRSQAVEEMVEDNVNGWRYDPFDYDSFREALVSITELNAEEFKHKQTKAKETSKKIAPEYVAQKFLNVASSIQDEGVSGTKTVQSQ